MKNKLKLCLHCGGEEVSLAQIAAVKPPEATATYIPIPHIDFINQVKKGLAVSNLEVVSEAHALAKGGDRYFGMLQVANVNAVDGEYALVCGLRNSQDKRFPAGIVAGASVFVCDNLSFSGEVDEFRKHTVNIMRDLPFKITKALADLNGLWSKQRDRFEAYHGCDIRKAKDLHDLLVRAWSMNAMPISYLPHVFNEYQSPTHEEFAARNVWSLFNAFTEILKKTSIHELSFRTQKLHLLLDDYCGIAVNKNV
jgi:hypothetical protein